MKDKFEAVMQVCIMVLMITMTVFIVAIAGLFIYAIVIECTDSEAEPVETESVITEEEVTVSESYGVGVVTDTADDGIEVKPYTNYEVYLIARTIAGEALITNSDTEMAAVAWCILNRVDSDRYPDTIEGVVTQANQFTGYWRDKEYSEHVEWLVEDVLERWYAEKDKVAEVGRVLPKEYVHFIGDGLHNYFTIEWQSTEYWDWSLPSPYES